MPELKDAAFQKGEASAELTLSELGCSNALSRVICQKSCLTPEQVQRRTGMVWEAEGEPKGMWLWRRCRWLYVSVRILVL